MLDFETWDVDLESFSALHATGAKIIAEGDPTNPDGVHPSNFPDNIAAMEQVKLVRCGLEAIAKAARSAEREKTRLLAEERRAAIRAAHKPVRPVLSLKRNTEKTA